MLVAVVVLASCSHLGETEGMAGMGQNLDYVRKLGAQARVAHARRHKASVLRNLATESQLPFPVPCVYFRAFKDEGTLEVWGSTSPEEAHRLLARYDIAGQSGTLGPKRREGDRQVPEGFYVIDRFNPASAYLLSLGLNYPNASDRLLGDKERPGGDIFIHGDTRSIGCLAMTDDKILEVYLWALLAKEAGQRKIRVDIFPFRFTEENLDRQGREHPELEPFWKSLQPVYVGFQESKRVPAFRVLSDGSYRVTGRFE